MSNTASREYITKRSEMAFRKHSIIVVLQTLLMERRRRRVLIGPAHLPGTFGIDPSTSESVASYSISTSVLPPVKFFLGVEVQALASKSSQDAPITPPLSPPSQKSISLPPPSGYSKDTEEVKETNRIIAGCLPPGSPPVVALSMPARNSSFSPGLASERKVKYVPAPAQYSALTRKAARIPPVASPILSSVSSSSKASSLSPSPTNPSGHKKVKVVLGTKPSNKSDLDGVATFPLSVETSSTEAQVLSTPSHERFLTVKRNDHKEDIDSIKLKEYEDVERNATDILDVKVTTEPTCDSLSDSSHLTPFITSTSSSPLPGPASKDKEAEKVIGGDRRLPDGVHFDSFAPIPPLAYSHSATPAVLADNGEGIRTSEGPCSSSQTAATIQPLSCPSLPTDSSPEVSSPPRFSYYQKGKWVPGREPRYPSAQNASVTPQTAQSVVLSIRPQTSLPASGDIDAMEDVDTNEEGYEELEMTEIPTIEITSQSSPPRSDRIVRMEDGNVVDGPDVEDATMAVESESSGMLEVDAYMDDGQQHDVEDVAMVAESESSSTLEVDADEMVSMEDANMDDGQLYNVEDIAMQGESEGGSMLEVDAVGMIRIEDAVMDDGQQNNVEDIDMAVDAESSRMLEDEADGNISMEDVGGIIGMENADGIIDMGDADMADGPQNNVEGGAMEVDSQDSVFTADATPQGSLTQTVGVDPRPMNLDLFNHGLKRKRVVCMNREVFGFHRGFKMFRLDRDRPVLPFTSLSPTVQSRWK
ncbi:hypothetical protein HDU67_007510 [Dinochytrium kinnereticum]|nr:hypothetical protein HDU67_007510 [Dinochytrium kinnereticum]